MATHQADQDLKKPLLTAYPLGSEPVLPIVPASISRSWMDNTRQRFAQRCLPLLIANQAGWFVLNSHKIWVTWDGGDDTTALEITYASGAPPYPAKSHFGHGIITWHIPYLFRTAPDYNLLVRGPSNWPKEGATALEGIVEADWSVATFTMNWKLTTVDRPVLFEAGEPICMLLPQRRGELETFEPVLADLTANPDLNRAYQNWGESRSRFLENLVVPESEAAKQLWQKEYFQGRMPDGGAAPAHQTRLHLREFTPPGSDTPLQIVDNTGRLGRKIEHPKRRGDLLIESLHDQTVVVDLVSGEHHELNQTALLIWEHCDGEHTLDDLAGVLVQRFALDADDARADVRDLVDQLEMAGLLTN